MAADAPRTRPYNFSVAERLQPALARAAPSMIADPETYQTLPVLPKKSVHANVYSVHAESIRHA